MMKSKMNGPFKSNIEIFVINDKTEMSGTVEVDIGAFEYPSKEKVKEALDKLDFKKGPLKGYRLMTKREAVNYVLTGCANPEIGVAIPGSKDWGD